MRAKTQDDLVKQDQGFKPKEEIVKVGLPGIEQLHTKSTDEIAEILAVILKSERGIQRLNWEIGKGIDLTIQRN